MSAPQLQRSSNDRQGRLLEQVSESPSSLLRGVYRDRLRRDRRREAQPRVVAVESTGGYERRLVAKLAEAGLPVVVVNPRRVRSFGEAMGRLAETDPIDARCPAAR